MERIPSHNLARRMAAPIVAMAGFFGLISHEQVQADGFDAYEANYAPPFDGAVKVGIPGAEAGDFTFLGLTVDRVEKPGYLALYGGDSDGQAVISHLNFAPGRVVTNTAGALVGEDGSVFAKNSIHGAIDVMADHKLTIDKEFVVPITPYRAFDSRDRGVPLSPGEEVCIPTPGEVGQSIAMNVTLVTDGATGGVGGYVTAYKGDAPRIPETSNLNYMPNQGIPSVNEVIVQIGPDGNKEVCLRNSETDSVHMIIDPQVIFTDGTFIPTASGIPERLVDTRIGLGGNRLPPGGRITMYVDPIYAGHAAILNVTPTNSGPGYGLVYGGNEQRPATSDVNYSRDIRPGLAFARVASDGSIIFENSNHSWTDVNLDFLGLINHSDGQIKNSDHTRRIDTRETGSKVEPSRTIGLTEIGFNSNPDVLIPGDADLSLELVHSRIPYGPHPEQYIDVYESLNHKDRAAQNDSAIEWYHGGGYNSGDNTLSTPYDRIARYMAAEHGQTLFSVNYRKTTEAPFPAQYDDAAAAHQFITNNAAMFGVNPRKIFMGGASAGGDIALSAVLRNQDSGFVQPQGLVLFAPMISKAAAGVKPPSQPALNLLAGVPASDPPAFHLYPLLDSFAQDNSSQQVPIYIGFSLQDDVIDLSGQMPAIQTLAQRHPVVLQYGGPWGHMAGNDANVPALLDFMRIRS